MLAGVVLLVVVGLAFGVQRRAGLFGSSADAPTPSTTTTSRASTTSPPEVKHVPTRDVAQTFPITVNGTRLSLLETGDPAQIPRGTTTCTEAVNSHLRNAAAFARGGEGDDPLGFSAYAYVGAPQAAQAKESIERNYRRCDRVTTPRMVDSGTIGRGTWSAWRAKDGQGRLFTSWFVQQDNVLTVGWAPDGSDVEPIAEAVTTQLDRLAK